MAEAISRLGIVGTGTMGAGIAQVAAQAGCDVWLFDASPGVVERALQRIERGLARNVERGTLTEPARSAALGRLHPAAELAALAEVEFAVEAVIERESAKLEVITALDHLLTGDA